MSQPFDLIVIGGGVTGLTAAYRAQQRGWRVLLREGSQRLGGSIGTIRSGGTLQELGAESMVIAKPWGIELCRELGLNGQLVSPQAEFRGTMIVRGGRLHSTPEGLRLLAPSQWLPFLRSSAVSWPGKLRMGLEFFVPRRTSTEDESLGDFVRRRLGREALERIAQPMVAGIYTADPDTLSMQATLPQFVDFERRYGSVCRGLLRSQEARQSSGPRYQLFTSLQGGFGQLIETLQNSLPSQALRVGEPVRRLEPLPEGGWQVDNERAQRVLIAVPTYVGADLVQGWDSGLAGWLRRMRYLSSATVNLVYDLKGLEAATRAYGFVVPSVEQRDILACTFSHRKYPGRSDSGTALLRTYVGGAARPEAVDWNDEEMVERSHRELTKLMRFKQSPKEWRVSRYRQAMPLYQVGHLRWLADLEDMMARWPGLTLAGNAYRGVGIPDCIRSAGEAIERLAQTSEVRVSP